jgi:hypothetical protein
MISYRIAAMRSRKSPRKRLTWTCWMMFPSSACSTLFRHLSDEPGAKNLCIYELDVVYHIFNFSINFFVHQKAHKQTSPRSACCEGNEKRHSILLTKPFLFPRQLTAPFATKLTRQTIRHFSTYIFKFSLT